MNLSVQERISRGLKRAEEAVDSGATTALLQRWISLTQSLVAPS
jgi:anthranilate phosphoribosyltransferase